MRIIDRYLLAQFIQVYVICFVSLTGLYIVIDAFSNLDEFIRHAETGGGLIGVMGQYYAYRSLAFFDRISGVLALIAAMFTITWIQRHQEMTALLAAGIRSTRVIAPVIVAASSISLLAAANRELVLPQIRNHLARDAQDLRGDVASEIQPRYDNETDVLLRGEKSLAIEKRIVEPSFLLPPALSQYGKHLSADDAFFQPAAENRPAGYLFRGVTQPRELATQPSLRLGERDIVLTPLDHDWLAADECFVASNVTFEMVEGGDAIRLYSSTPALIRGLSSPSLDFGSDVRVAIHGRIVQPVLDVTLLFLGMPLVLSRNNRSVFVAIGLCVVLALGFMLVVITCRYLGASYWISPTLSAWLPLMVFIPIAVAMSDPLRE